MIPDLGAVIRYLTFLIAESHPFDPSSHTGLVMTLAYCSLYNLRAFLFVFSSGPFTSNGAEWGTSSTSFIFSLKNQIGMHFKAMVHKKDQVTFKAKQYGPTFGPGFDIYIADNAGNNVKSSTAITGYTLPTLPGGVDGQNILAVFRNFKSDEVEVSYLV